MLTFAQQSGITCNTLDSMLPIPLYLPEAFEKGIYAVARPFWNFLPFALRSDGRWRRPSVDLRGHIG